MRQHVSPWHKFTSQRQFKRKFAKENSFTPIKQSFIVDSLSMSTWRVTSTNRQRWNFMRRKWIKVFPFDRLSRKFPWASSSLAIFIAHHTPYHCVVVEFNGIVHMGKMTFQGQSNLAFENVLLSGENFLEKEKCEKCGMKIPLNKLLLLLNVLAFSDYLANKRSTERKIGS